MFSRPGSAIIDAGFNDVSEGAVAVAVSGEDWAMVPLPMGPGGGVVIAPGVEVLIDDDGAGSVFLWGMAAWYWQAGDEPTRRLAAVQLVNTGHVLQRAVAEVFEVNETTLWRWRTKYTATGTGALIDEQKGPKRRWKLTDEKIRKSKANTPTTMKPASRRKYRKGMSQSRDS